MEFAPIKQHRNRAPAITFVGMPRSKLVHIIEGTIDYSRAVPLQKKLLTKKEIHLENRKHEQKGNIAHREGEPSSEIE